MVHVVESLIAAEFVDYLEAFSTLAAVVVALVLPFALTRYRRPRLTASVEQHESLERTLAAQDFAVMAGEDGPQDRRVEYLECIVRVRVDNASGKRSAVGTRALLLSVTWQERPGSEPEILAVPDCLFKWAGPSFGEDVAIPPGTFRRLDVLRYRCEPNGPAERDAILVPALNRPRNTDHSNDAHWPPSARNRLTRGGHYCVEFVVSCDEAAPVFCYFEFDFAETAGRPTDEKELAARITHAELEHHRSRKQPITG